jgi:hypothetical protein
MMFANPFVQNRKGQPTKPAQAEGLLASNGIDANLQSQRSYGLIGSGAYHHYKGENQETNSLRFGAFSALSALRDSPLRESKNEVSQSNESRTETSLLVDANPEPVNMENSH